MDAEFWSLVHIPGYDETDASATVEALVADIEPKLASILIRELNENFPLPDLNHVKRIRRLSSEDGVKLSIILCLLEQGESKHPAQLQELIEKHALQTRNLKISKYAASSREEWEAQCLLWPTSFHPNCLRPKRLEFDQVEMIKASKFMRMALHQASLARTHGRLRNGAVIVDPAIGQVIATAYDESRQPSCSDCSKCSGYWHPLRHAAIVAIDKAAERDRLLFPDSADEGELLDGPAKRQRVEVGTTKTTSAVEFVGVSRPYMCTGFDIYLVREPCAMCAMAMVHQRFRKVYFGVSNPLHGALGGSFHLHRQQSLNHHYTVIQVSLSKEDLA